MPLSNPHIEATSVHSATPDPTASRLIVRDASGRAAVAAPSAADDIARKDTVDTVQTNLNTHKTAATLDHPDSSVTAAKIADRQRRFLVQAVSGKNVTDGTEITRGNEQRGWPLVDGKLCEVVGGFFLPIDYVSDLEIEGMIITQFAGVIYNANHEYHSAQAEAWDTHSTTPGCSVHSLPAGQRYDSSKITPANVSAGDFFDLKHIRDAADAQDTMNATVWFNGFEIRYTADS